MAPLLTGQEVAKHNTRESCWIIVHGKAPTVRGLSPATFEGAHGGGLQEMFMMSPSFWTVRGSNESSVVLKAIP